MTDRSIPDMSNIYDTVPDLDVNSIDYNGMTDQQLSVLSNAAEANIAYMSSTNPLGPNEGWAVVGTVAVDAAKSVMTGNVPGMVRAGAAIAGAFGTIHNIGREFDQSLANLDAIRRAADGTLLDRLRSPFENRLRDGIPSNDPGRLPTTEYSAIIGSMQFADRSSFAHFDLSVPQQRTVLEGLKSAATGLVEAISSGLKAVANGFVSFLDRTVGSAKEPPSLAETVAALGSDYLSPDKAGIFGAKVAANGGYSYQDRDENGELTGAIVHKHADGSPAGTSYSSGHGEGYTPSSGREKRDQEEAERSESGGSDGGKPILLDLDDNGIEITELSKSTQFFDTGGDGLLHRTAWAGDGDGVLFIDDDGDGTISEKREFVFTEWDPTAKDDLEALRAAFDSNDDGVLDASDARFADFKVLVTNPDGSTTAQTLAQLGITEIDLTADTTRIELPDGSMITGQTSFTRSDGSTGTVANATLMADAQGYNVAQVESTDAAGNRVVVSTAYAANGDVAYAITSVTSPDGSSVTNSYDDDGDGVVDRLQTIETVADIHGNKTETTVNRAGSDLATAIVVNRVVTTTSVDGGGVTIQRDSRGGGWFDQEEIRTTLADGSRTMVIRDLAEDGSVIRGSSETTSVDGLMRVKGTDGFVPLSKTGAELLFELISQRYERGSTMIISNLPCDEWTETFGTERLTGALLDRLTHHVTILEMNGDSYRLGQSRARKTDAAI